MLILPTNVHNEIMYYVRKCKTEVSGMGRMVITKDGDFLVNKIYLLEQEVGAAHTDIDAEAIAKLLFDTRDDEGDLLYWWHSHVDMQAFWSATDLATIKAMGANGLCVASVFNKRGESKHASCYSVTTSYSNNTELVCNESIPHILGVPPTNGEMAVWDLNIKSKVREKKYQAQDYAYKFKYNGYDESIEGILGYGVHEEARAVGIPVEKYKAIVEGTDGKKYKELEENLEKAWHEGKFSHIESKYYE